jgi:hypothetical protein
MLAATLLADISSVDANHLKDFVIIAIGVGIFAIQIIGAIRNRGAQKREVSFSEEFVTKQVCATAHADYARRIDAAEKQLVALWDTLRSENESIRDELRRGFQDMERALGRIEGQLNKDR